MWQAVSPKGDVDCGSTFGDHQQEPDVKCGMCPGEATSGEWPRQSHRVTRQLAIGGTRKGRGAAGRELQEAVLSRIWKACKDLIALWGRHAGTLALWRLVMKSHVPGILVSPKDFGAAQQDSA